MKSETDKEFFEALSSIDNSADMQKFLTEILTKKELKDLCLRWRLLRMIEQGNSQRKTAAELGISLCKITRGAKLLRDTKSVTYSLLKNPNSSADK